MVTMDSQEADAPAGRGTYNSSWLQAASVTSGKSSQSISQHTSRQQHTIILVSGIIRLYNMRLPSSGFQHFDANWRYFDVFFFFCCCCCSCSWRLLVAENTQEYSVTNSTQLKIHKVHFYGISISPPLLDRKIALSNQGPSLSWFYPWFYL